MKKYEFTVEIRDINPDLVDRTFTEEQFYEVYRDVVDKEEYPDFQCWLYDMKKCGLVIESKVEITKDLQLLDAIEDIRQKANEHPANYPLDYTIRLITAMVACNMGYTDRTEWTEILKQCENSRYYNRLKENRFYL